MSFTFQIQTTSNNQTFSFQADAGTLVIDWGDTQTTTESTPTTGLRSHTYTTAGTYNISLNGVATRIAFYGGTPKLLKDVLTKMSDGLTGITSGNSMFRGCTQITTFTEPAFFDAVSGNITTMEYMFSGATDFNQPIGNWNTSKVTSMSNMFRGATNFNQPIGNWNTSKVTTMKAMFRDATNFNQPLNSWNTSKVTDISQMFWSVSYFNQPLNNWDTSSVTIMQYLFYGAKAFNQPIGNWNTSKVTNMGTMFSGATSFNGDISNWNVSSLIGASSMFSGVTLPTVVYDGILIKWSNQTLKTKVTISFGGSKYSNGLPLESKNKIASNFTWTITDGGSTGTTYIEPQKSKISSGATLKVNNGENLKFGNI